MTFNEAFEKVLGHEGGLSMDRMDRGNWTSGKIGVGILKGTKYGISAMAYPRLDIMNLTLDEAKKIYHKDYWLKSKAHKLPKEIRYMYFDMAVNQGLSKAAKVLQKTAKVVQDGIIGNVTLNASENVTLTALALNRVYDYINIIIRNPLMIRYINGWFKRVYQIATHV